MHLLRRDRNHHVVFFFFSAASRSVRSEMATAACPFYFGWSHLLEIFFFFGFLHYFFNPKSNIFFICSKKYGFPFLATLSYSVLCDGASSSLQIRALSSVIFLAAQQRRSTVSHIRLLCKPRHDLYLADLHNSSDHSSHCSTSFLPTNW